MKLKNLIPWRVRNFTDQWLENSVRPEYPSVYKLLKFGRKNINTPGYWDKVWMTDTLPRDYEGLFNAIIAYIPYGASVLDVGCGVGRLARLMRDKCHARVTGLDFSCWACEQLARDGFKTVVSSLPKIPLPDNVFDVAVATEVLEHLDQPEKTVLQMTRVVRHGGIIICSVPKMTPCALMKSWNISRAMMRNVCAACSPLFLLRYRSEPAAFIEKGTNSSSSGVQRSGNKK